MKVSIIGTVGLPPVYGGFETLAAQIVSYLQGKIDFTVYCSSKKYKQQHKSYKKAALVYVPFNANGVESIPYDVLSIFHAVRRSDVLLILGVSGCIALPFVKLMSRNKVIVNIDGLEWKRDKWSRLAKWFLKLSEKIAVRYADRVIADNAVIREYVRSTYGIDAHLIAYGGDHTTAIPIDGFVDEYPFVNEPYAFGICRIEPENNVHVILDAFARMNRMPLVMVGNWKNSEYGLRLKDQYDATDGVLLLDAIYDQTRVDMLRSNCSLYLHGHSAGGTNPSLVEAMWLGLPIFAYDVAYNRETTENSAKYFKDADDLVHVLGGVTEADLAEIATRMHETAARRYRWQGISNAYETLMV